MESPKFANRVAVSHNQTEGGFVMNFYHDFPIFDENDNQEGAPKLGREFVGGIVMSNNLAAQLQNIIGTHLAAGKDNG